MVVAELGRLRKLAGRLLLLASAGTPGFLDRKPVATDQLLLDALERWGYTHRRWRLGEVAEVRVVAVEDRLAAALDALIENAVAHTGTDDTIELSAQVADGHAVFTVTDSGCGIPPEDLDRIFDRVSRARPYRSRESGGFVLGLPTVRAIAEAHGGAVRVRSTVSAGATFEVLVPVTPAPEPAVSQAHNARHHRPHRSRGREKMVGVRFDYIVVGAGAAGCVLAGRLAAADPRVTVLLIEYGGRPVNPLLHIPKGFYYTLRGDRYLYRYPTNPVNSAAGQNFANPANLTRPANPAASPRRREIWLRGKALGGSAAVNGMMWMRGAPADWDALAARGNPGWSWADVRPAYQAMEDHSLGPGETRGTGGPLGITVTESEDEVTRAVLAAAVGYGWQHVRDANAHDTERIAFTPSTIKDGRRTTSYGAYVRPLLRPRGGRGAGARAGNLTVATRTRAGHLLFDGNRVTGVRVRDSGGTVRDITAREEVILCAGAIESPLILERSGIGDPGRLRALGITPRIESPNVGERLVEQRGVALQVTLNQEAGQARRLDAMPRQAREALRYLATRTGPLATAGYDLVCQFKSDPSLDRPDVQGLFVPMALDTRSTHMKLARHPGILFMAYPIRPVTRGSVHVSSHDPGDPPAIDPRFLEDEADQRSVAPVLGIARDLLSRSPVAELIAAEEFPGPSVTTREEVVGYSLTSGSGIYHAVGTAAMGPGDDDVTDPQLRVRGVTGLRIADASVLPAQVSGNTAAPAMLVGYRAAELIRAARAR